MKETRELDKLDTLKKEKNTQVYTPSCLCFNSSENISGIGRIGNLKKRCLVFARNVSGWLLTLAYEPKFCSRSGASIGRRVPVLQYAVLLGLAVAVAAVVRYLLTMEIPLDDGTPLGNGDTSW